MDGERKRKRKSLDHVGTGKDWEDKKRRIGKDVGNPGDGEEHDGASQAAVGDRRAAEDDVEAEVEEFFAIVRRMHAAARQFSVVGGWMAAASARQAQREDEERGLGRWRPAFEWEDFEDAGHYNFPNASERSHGRRGEVASVASAPNAAEGVGRKREDRTAEGGVAVRLDLNADPEPEHVLG